MTQAYIALGSNLRDPHRQLRRAVNALQALPHTRLEKASSVYRSAAIGPGEQPDYLNAVIRIETALPPIDLLDTLQRIEHEQDRVRDVCWGPRTLDLDLLLYGDKTLDTPRLTLPHPRMRQRHFVLYPLREIAGASLRMPDGTELDTLLLHCPADGLVKTRYRLQARQPARRAQHALDLL